MKRTSGCFHGLESLKVWLAAAVAFGAFCPSLARADVPQELVKNGSFEQYTGTLANWSGHWGPIGGDVTVPPWSVSGGVGLTDNQPTSWIYGVIPPDASFVCYMQTVGSGSDAHLTQTVTVPEDGDYLLSFWCAARFGSTETAYAKFDDDEAFCEDITSGTFSQRSVVVTLTKGDRVFTLGARNPEGGDRGMFFDKVSLKRCDDEKLLLHRWSFNGSLDDSVGKLNATHEGASWDDNSNPTMIRLNGGKNGSSYVNIPATALPKDRPFTIEMFAVQREIQSWSRIFSFGVGNPGSDSQKSFFMSWSRTTNANQDEVLLRYDGTSKSFVVDDSMQPYTVGTKWHIALTYEPMPDGKGRFYWRKEALDGSGCRERSATTTFDVDFSTWGMDNFWLGRSYWSADGDAKADYDEVRIWGVALTPDQLAANALKGPDTLPEDAKTFSPRTMSVAEQTDTSVTFAFGGTDNLPYGLYMAAGATDGGDDKGAWTDFMWVTNVASSLTSLTYEVPETYRDGRNIRFFLMQTNHIAMTSELTSVRSDGSQWVDTEFYRTDRMCMDFRFGKVTYEKDACFFGRGWDCDRYLLVMQGDKFVFYGSADPIGDHKPDSLLDYRLIIDDDSRLTLTEKQSGKVIGESNNRRTIAGDQGNLTLFCRDEGASRSKFTFYRMKIAVAESDNGRLQRDLVPAKNSAGVPGLYDNVNDVFYLAKNANLIADDGTVMPSGRFGRVLDETPTFRFRRSVKVESVANDTITLGFGNPDGKKYALYVGYGTTDGGDDKNAWANFKPKVGDIEADDTTYDYTLPPDLKETGTTFHRFFLIQTEGLPYEQELASLTSTGAQTVRLGYIPGPDTQVDMRVGNVDCSEYTAFFGQSWAGSSYMLCQHSGGRMYFFGSASSLCTIADNTNYRFETLTGGDLVISSSAASSRFPDMNFAATQTFPLSVFSTHGGLHPGKFRFDSMVVRDNGLVVSDLVPVKTSEGKGALYDRANDVLYPNATSTDFTLGGEATRQGRVLGETATTATITLAEDTDWSSGVPSLPSCAYVINLNGHTLQLAPTADVAAFTVADYTTGSEKGVLQLHVTADQTFADTAFTLSGNLKVVVDAGGAALELGTKLVGPVNALQGVTIEPDATTVARGAKLDVRADDGVYYAADPTSTVATAAHWTGAAGDNDLSAVANWCATNLAGAEVFCPILSTETEVFFGKSVVVRVSDAVRSAGDQTLLEAKSITRADGVEITLAPECAFGRGAKRTLEVSDTGIVLHVENVSDSSAYIQRGLEAQFDGINNAGYGEHSSSTNIWKDLTGNGYDATKNSSNVTWGENGWSNEANGRPFVLPLKFSTFMNKAEFSIDFSVKPSRKDKRETFLGQYDGSGFGIEHNSGSVSSGTIRFYYNGNPDKMSTVISEANSKDNFIYTAKTKDHKLYKNGVQDWTSTEAIGTVPAIDKLFYIGGEGKRDNMAFHGEWYALRVYNRVLTAEEAKINSAIDQVRYFGKTVAEVNTGVMPAGWSLKESDGVLLLHHQLANGLAVGAADIIEEDSLEFTNKTATLTFSSLASSGTTHAIIGEMVVHGSLQVKVPDNITSGDWTLLAAQAIRCESGGSISLSPSCATGGGTVRALEVTESKIVLHVVKVPDSSVYIQRQLQAQFDGIDNAGRGTHSMSTNVWTDLTGHGHDAQRVAGSANVTWLANGWSNNADGKPFKLPLSFSEMLNPTVFTIDFSVKPSRQNARQFFLSQYDAYNKGSFSGVSIEHNAGDVTSGALRFYYENNPDLRTTDPLVKAEQNVANNFIYTAKTEDHKLYKNGKQEWTSNKAITYFPDVRKHFCIGGAPLDDTFRNEKAFRGEWYTLRVYNRILTAEEAAINSAIDQVRYFGKTAETVNKDVMPSGWLLKASGDELLLLRQYGDLTIGVTDFLEEDSVEFTNTTAAATLTFSSLADVGTTRTLPGELIADGSLQIAVPDRVGDGDWVLLEAKAIACAQGAITLAPECVKVLDSTRTLEVTRTKIILHAKIADAGAKVITTADWLGAVDNSYATAANWTCFNNQLQQIRDALPSSGTIATVGGRTFADGEQIMTWTSVPDATFVLPTGVAGTLLRCGDGLRYYTKAYSVEIGGKSAAIALNDKQLENIGCSPNSTSEEINTALNTQCANGYTKFVNLVLGLSQTDSKDKPLVVGVQTEKPDKIALRMGNVKVDTTTGATVKYRVMTCNSPSDTTGTPSDPVDYNETVLLDEPSAEDPVKYYKIQIKTTPAQ